MNRVGVTEFIFSSTNAIWDFEGGAMHREAREMLRIAGAGAHPFFWVTDEYLKRDPDLSNLPNFYAGFKLHGGETPWLRRARLLRLVLSIARERHFPVQIHTGGDDDGETNPIRSYLPFCKEFSTVKFDLAHGKPFAEVPLAVNSHDNIYVDCAYCSAAIVDQWLAAGAREDRILFGSDIPVQQKLGDTPLTDYLRRTLRGFTSHRILYQNFQDFLAQ